MQTLYIMITRYEIKKEKEEEVLYLYMNYNYEFAQELGNPSKKMTLLSEVKNYMNKMKIKFKGKYIVLVIAGLASITLACSADKLETTQTSFTPTPDILEILNYETYPSLPVMTAEKEEKPMEKVETSNPSISSPQENNAKPKVPTKPATTNQQNKVISNSKPTVSKPSTTSPTEKVEEVKPVIKETMVTIYRSTGVVETLELETYLIGVVAAEMPASFEIDALKAQAIVARTYALNRMQQGKVLTDTVSTQAYKDNNQLKKTWGNDFNKYYNKIKSAVDDTKGMVITYQGKYIDAVFHSTSNGYTVDAKDIWGQDIPYLKSVDSPFDLSASSYLRETTKQIHDIEQKLGITITPDSSIEILEKDEHGRVLKVKIDEQVYNGIEMRTKLGLRSTDFDIEINGDTIKFTTKGFGHGVGMSQYGAQGMAKNGYNYSQIIKHYYTGVDIIKK